MPEISSRDPRISWPAGFDPSSAVVFAHNEIKVQASAERIWSLLVDCTRWPRWYAHCSDVVVLRGGPVLEAGSQFRVKTLGRYFEPVVQICAAPDMLVWSAKGPAGTSGAHAWRIERTSTGSQIITEEAQTGLMLRLVRARVRRQLLAMHDDWLSSLKTLAETS